MGFDTWQAFYASELQSVHALIVLPALFLLARFGGWLRGSPGALPEAGGLVRLWAWLFAVETIVDPIATGPVAKALGNEGAATALMFCFVWLGDVRVMWLVLALSRVRRSAAWAFVASPAIGLVAAGSHALVGLALPEAAERGGLCPGRLIEPAVNDQRRIDTESAQPWRLLAGLGCG